MLKKKPQEIETMNLVKLSFVSFSSEFLVKNFQIESLLYLRF